MIRLLLLVLSASVLPLPAGADLLALDAPSTSSGLPVGWQLRSVRGQSAPTFSVHRDDPDGARLRIEGTRTAAWAVRPLSMPIEDAAGQLAWSWRVLAPPDGADLRLPAHDDSPLRVIVVFGKPPGPFGGSGRLLFYTWGADEPAGFEARSRVSSKMYVIRAAGREHVGEQWHDIDVAPFEDFRRIWGRTPPPITAIGVMQDTDATGALAIAEIRGMRWRSAGAAAGFPPE